MIKHAPITVTTGPRGSHRFMGRGALRYPLIELPPPLGAGSLNRNTIPLSNKKACIKIHGLI